MFSWAKEVVCLLPSENKTFKDVQKTLFEGAALDPSLEVQRVAKDRNVFRYPDTEELSATETFRAMVNERPEVSKRAEWGGLGVNRQQGVLRIRTMKASVCFDRSSPSTSTQPTWQSCGQVSSQSVQAWTSSRCFR